ncbi:group II intron reverse transcriptase/maturase [Saccharobesus litoralis]|uniref:Group II intron reverse transcriptase/maturase n=1 Tax=Saccharobesus litoralis TaxID=2172099 RepID=A0A2S0VQU4_9ALTE|nr:group II intron reverse transcriptase/maturase [Saccharobesus litoralis]AWB66587.1 group II intron reverse transcriptase/maturase [Saccharobesus litoralis]
MISAKPFSISKWTVYEAWLRVKANGGAAGIDEQSISDFEQDLKKNLYKIWNRMSSGSYFPPTVKRVEIPKDKGIRVLGIPTVSDRVAQMVVKMELEPELESVFDNDSYGYRPNRSAHDALTITRKRCWQYDWVIDLDIKGFFDNLNWELLGKALRKHTNNPWVLLYIDRWLKAPMETSDGLIIERTKGTPQGGVISPLLANLFLHYAFDMWLRREHPDVQFARYADDAVVHCRSEQEARALKHAIEQRMLDCCLECHPEKTKLVYCFDAKRRQPYDVVSFDFLGYCFRPRLVRSRWSGMFVSFTPAISPKAKQKIRTQIKSYELHRRTTLTIRDLANKLNPILKGWIEYYGRYWKTELKSVFYVLNQRLLKWAKSKYKRLRTSNPKVNKWLIGVYQSQPNLFAHWQLGCRP